MNKLFNHQDNRERIICADGFKMSVQASHMHYCIPKVNGLDVYYSYVEVGSLSEDEILLNPYQDGEDSDVYAYVPAAVIILLIKKHCGMTDGSLPNLIADTMLADEIAMYEDEHICEHGNSYASNCSDCDIIEYSSNGSQSCKDS